MADRIQSDNQREINPNFAIPEGLRVYTYETVAPSPLEEQSVDGAGADLEDDIDTDESSEEDYESDDDTPDTPDIYGIISQTITTAPDGSQVVNVVLDVEDLESALSKYDVRFT